MASINNFVRNVAFTAVAAAPVLGYAGAPADGPVVGSAPALGNAPTLPAANHSAVPAPRNGNLVYRNQVCDIVEGCDLDAQIDARLKVRFPKRTVKKGPNYTGVMWNFLDLNPATKSPHFYDNDAQKPLTLIDVIDYRVSMTSFTSDDPNAQARLDVFAAKLAGMDNQRFVLTTTFDQYKADQTAVDAAQDERINGLNGRVGDLENTLSAARDAPVAAAVESAPAPASSPVYTGTLPVVVDALADDEARRKAFGDAEKVVCGDNKTKNDAMANIVCVLSEQRTKELAAAPADKDAINAKYDTMYSTSVLQLQDLSEKCLELQISRDAVESEYNARVKKNLAGLDSFALGVFAGYEQGLVGGVTGQWNPFANSIEVGGYGSFFVRHLGLNVAAYGVFGAESKSESVTVDAGDGWSSRTTVGKVEHPFLGARASLRVPILGNMTESVVLSLEGGVNGILSSKNTSPSTVTTVDGTAPRGTEGNPEYQTKVTGYGFGGLQLDLGPVFIQAGVNQAGLTEEGSVTPYGLLGATYRF